MDTNHDGYVSSEEFRAASDARRAERRKELEKKHAERRKERSRRSNMEDSAHYSAMDTNKDGRVSHEEFEAYRKQKQQEHARKRAEHKARVEERRKEMQENSEQFRKDAEHVQEHDMGAPGNTGGTGSGR